MDRSFLSQPTVIAASRAFVCVRLATYENKQEAELLKTIFVGRSGEVENTTFAILAPDGKQQLVRSGRAARNTFASAAEMAESMNQIARRYEGRNSTREPELPVVATPRLALDVAACDNRPLALLAATEPAVLRQMEDRVRKLAWSNEFAGQAIYAITSDFASLKMVEGIGPDGGLLIIQPDRFGQKGKVLAQAAPNATPAELSRTLRTGIGLHQRSERDFRGHVRDGHQAGIFWETVLPVTDPLEKRAREQKGAAPPPPR